MTIKLLTLPQVRNNIMLLKQLMVVKDLLVT